VKARQERFARPTRPDRPQGQHGYWESRRPQHLLSGLIKCGACGAGMVLVGKTHYGCAAARNKGTCGNHLSIRRDVLEASVLTGLQRHLVTPELTREFIAAYHDEINRARASLESDHKVAEKALAKAEAAIRNIIEAVKGGLFHPSMKAELDALEARKAELSATLAAPPPMAVRLHPNLGELYSSKIKELVAALNRPEDKAEAADILRGLITEIRLVPESGRYEIELTGDLADLLGFAAGSGNAERPGALLTGRSRKLVAGAGFEPATFRL
jgi:site-specific DNA recombinase